MGKGQVKTQEELKRYCYKCGCELGSISQMLKVKDKRPHNEEFCIKCSEIIRGIRDERGVRI